MMRLFPVLAGCVGWTAATAGTVFAAAEVDDTSRPLPQPAHRADAFVESIGLNAAPFDGRHTEGPYAGAGTFYPPEVFLDLGVRYYRMSLASSLTEADTPRRVREAFEAHGVRPLLLIDPLRVTKTPAEVVEWVKRYGGDVAAGIEGPNEVNNKFPPQVLNLHYGGMVDEAAGAAFMDDVTAALDADAETRDIPVVGFTAIFTDYTLARPHDGFDFGNMHSYQGGDVPSSSLLMNVTRWNNILPAGSVIRPIQPTEAGYNVEADRTNQQGWTGSLRAQARNIPMLLTEYFLHGIPRTYLFALHNADGYGLLDDDQTTKRPSYFVVKNLIAALGDATWDRGAMRWVTPAFEPRSLPFTLGGAPPSVHTLTLQRGDGSYQLLVWNEVRNFDHARGGELDPAAVEVTIRFGVAAGDRATLLTQNNGGGYDRSELTLGDGGRTLRLPVHSRVSIVDLSPPAPEDTAAPPAPRDLAGEATEAEVLLRWAGAASGEAVGYFVYRNGRHVATLPLSETALRDATPWVRPGLGYTYGIESYDAAGNVSPREQVVVVTPDRRPDLVVDPPRMVSLDGAELGSVSPGERVRFATTVRNVGAGQSPHGVPVGASFRVGEGVYLWQTVDGPLPAGASLDLVSQGGGPFGDGTWVAEAGARTVAAITDDINRVSGEAGEGNNLADATVSIAADHAGVLTGESRPAPAVVDLTAEGVLDWAVFGAGGKDAAVRKRGGGLLGAMETFGEGHVDATSGFPVRAVWSDGEPIASSAGTNDGLWLNGVGHVFRFTADTDDEEARVLRVYVAGIEGATGKLVARLSDGSAPEFVSTTWNGNRGNGDWAAIPGGFAAVYALRYRGGTPDARLTVEWSLGHEPNAWRGQVRLGPVTVAPASTLAH